MKYTFKQYLIQKIIDGFKYGFKSLGAICNKYLEVSEHEKDKIYRLIMQQILEQLSKKNVSFNFVKYPRSKTVEIKELSNDYQEPTWRVIYDGGDHLNVKYGDCFPDQEYTCKYVYEQEDIVKEISNTLITHYGDRNGQ